MKISKVNLKLDLMMKLILIGMGMNLLKELILIIIALDGKDL
jgi:hypothetical protein